MAEADCDPPTANGKLPWRSPDADKGARTLAQFIVLSADVIGHSEFIKAAKSDRAARALDDTLTSLENWIKHELGADATPDLCWDWAGDGGLFGFLADQNGDRYAAQVVEAAIAIWQGLEAFNERHNCYKRFDEKAEIRLRIAVAKGTAYFSDNPSRRRSHALNVVGKLKVPERFTTVSITKDVREELPDELRQQFRTLHMRVLSEDIYGFVAPVERGLQSGIDTHREANPVFAAYYQHKLFESYVLQGRLPDAKRCLNDMATSLKNADTHKVAPYYHRVVQADATAWQKILGTACDSRLPEVQAEGSLLQVLRTPVTMTDTTEIPKQLRPLPLHLAFIFSQLDKLEGQFVNSPTGLSALEICQLLLRAGMPPAAGRRHIQQRLDRIKDEKDRDTASLDDECTLCTATAVSCRALAALNTEGPEETSTIAFLHWLEDKKGARYCFLRGTYTDAEPHQHAMHYAARVLEAALAAEAHCEASDRDRIQTLQRSVLHQFFRDEKGNLLNDVGAVLDHWLRYRNITAIEVLGRILPAFVRWWLAKGDDGLEIGQKAILGKVLERCGDMLAVDCDNISKDAPQVQTYAVRESLGALSLGMLLAQNGAFDDAILKDRRHAVLRQFHKRAAKNAPGDALSVEEFDDRRGVAFRRRWLFESDVNRLVHFIDGWLLYWETVLFLRDRGDDVATLVPDWSVDDTTRPATA